MAKDRERASGVPWVLAYAGVAVAALGMIAWFFLSPKAETHSAQLIEVPKAPPITLIEGESELAVVPNGETRDLSFALSAAVFESAPAVIVTSPESLQDAADAAEIPLPILVLPAEPSGEDIEALTHECERLGVNGVFAHGVSLPEVFGEPRRLNDADLEMRTVLVDGDPTVAQQLLAGTGWSVIESSGDPRASAATIEALAQAPEAPAVVVGEGNDDLAWQVAVAKTGIVLPTGTQLAAPEALYVALYGHPAGGALGVLGEQGVDATIERAKKHAAPYRDLVDVPVIPSLEIIATVASAGAGDDGNYSAESDLETLRPLIDAAGDAGMYVVLDLQPGRTDFLTQAKLYEEFLLRPYVGLALDPEWRLKPDQVHLRQIGQVDAAEVNTVVEWLADLTRENHLPQKILILHSFQNRMIANIEKLNTSRDELAIVIHVDGQGPQGAKQATWNALRHYAPNVDLWGWKNFYDEDTPKMLTPQQTIANVDPRPIFVSYQ